MNDIQQKDWRRSGWLGLDGHRPNPSEVAALAEAHLPEWLKPSRQVPETAATPDYLLASHPGNEVLTAADLALCRWQHAGVQYRWNAFLAGYAMAQEQRSK